MLSIFKCHSTAVLPSFATESSACFDLHACLPVGAEVKRRGLSNSEHTITVKENQSIEIKPGERILIPTGLIFDIPTKHSLRIHPRSGLAFKNGISLSNSEGVVDEDYVEPVFVCLINTSGETFVVKHGDRIAQAELCLDTRCEIYERSAPPKRKTSRSGGFGSTGV